MPERLKTPDAGHLAAVTQRIEFFVVELRHRLKVEHHHRHLGFLHHRQHGRRERVGGDEKEDYLDILPLEQRRCATCLFGVVNHARIDQIDAHVHDAVADFGMIAVQVVEQSVKLRPVGIESYRKNSRLHCFAPYSGFQ